MKEVTDPALIAQLESAAPIQAPPGPMQDSLVTDPTTLLALDHGFDVQSFGTDFRAARKAIDRLPPEVRKTAEDAYAKQFVTQERQPGTGIIGGINSAIGAIDDHIRGAAQNVPFLGEFADEANAATAEFQGGDSRLAHAAEQQRRKQADATNYPGINTPLGRINTLDVAKGAGLVGGAIAAPIARVFGVGGAAAPTLAQSGGNAAINTALMVGADSAGQKDGSVGERVAQGVQDGLIAAPLGFAAGYGGQGLSNWMTRGRLVSSRAGETIDDLRAQGQTFYTAAENAGVIYSRPAAQRLQQGIQQDATQFAYHPQLQPMIRPLIEEAERLTQGNVTMQGLDALRRMAGNVRASGNPSERRLAGQITDRIDDIMMQPQAGDVIAGNGAAANWLVEGRDLWRRMRKTELVEEAIETARFSTGAAGSGGNINNNLRREIGKLVKPKAKTRRMFTPDERDLMTEFAHGTVGSNWLRRVGKLSPEGNGLMLSVHALGGIASAGSTLPIGIVGLVSKRLADNGANRSADLVRDAVSSASPVTRQVATWQRVLRSATATPATRRAATVSLAAAISKATGDAKEAIQSALDEIAAANPESIDAEINKFSQQAEQAGR